MDLWANAKILLHHLSRPHQERTTTKHTTHEEYQNAHLMPYTCGRWTTDNGDDRPADMGPQKRSFKQAYINPKQHRSYQHFCNGKGIKVRQRNISTTALGPTTMDTRAKRHLKRGETNTHHRGHDTNNQNPAVTETNGNARQPTIHSYPK